MAKELRYERKFVLNFQDTDSTILYLKKSKAIFKEIFYKRQVNSIYFDTRNLNYYYNNVFGQSNRKKLRVRWYSDNINNITKGNLEIKAKESLVGYKDTFSLGNYDTVEFINNYVQYFEKSNIPNDIKIPIKSLKPVLFVSYTRQYFTSADKKFRITLDYNLKYADLKFKLIHLNFIKTNTQVLELKYSIKNDKHVSELAKIFGARYTKCSKYTMGMDIFNT